MVTRKGNIPDPTLPGTPEEIYGQPETRPTPPAWASPAPAKTPRAARIELTIRRRSSRRAIRATLTAGRGDVQTALRQSKLWAPLLYT